MKLSIKIIALMMSLISSYNIGMEIEVPKKNPQNVVDLLENNGKYLKKLIAIENNGCFSQDLYKAEETLQNFNFFNINPEQEYSQETIQLASLIAQRGQDYKQLYEALAKYDFNQAESIIHKNKYCLNSTDNNRVLLSCTTDSSIAEFLIISGANVNQKNIVGHTPLFHQIDNDKIRSVLLHYGARINDTDDNGNTILHDVLASGFRLRKIINMSEYYNNRVDFLLSQGANPEICNKVGETSFDIIVQHNLPVLKLLEKYGYVLFSHQENAMYQNAYMLLKNNAAYLKELDYNAKTAQLYKAVLYLTYLFNYYCKKHDDSPDCYLSSQGIFVNNKICIFKRASLQDCKAFFGEDALAYAEGVIKNKNNIKRHLKSLLYTAAEDKDLEALKNIVEMRLIADKRWQDTVLRKLIKNHDNKSLKYCLKHDFDPKGLTGKKPNPLEFAVQCNNAKAVKLLIEYGYDLFEINNAFEESIVCSHPECIKVLQERLEDYLCYTCIKHSCEEVQLLLKAGIDVKRALYGKDPQWYAKKSGCESCAQLLVNNQS